jgi:hypothetical protein
VPRLRINGAIPPLPYAFMACIRENLTFTFFITFIRAGREVTTHLHLVPRLRINGATPPLPYAFMACTRESFTFIFFIKFIQGSISYLCNKLGGLGGREPDEANN